MKLSDAVDAFENWSMPWTFDASVRAALGADSEERKKFDSLVEEAAKPEHWRAADLPFACKIAHSETKAKFPEVDDHVIASIVRAVSYSWR